MEETALFECLLSTQLRTLASTWDDSRMRTTLLVVTIAALACCSAPEDRRAALMDRVEGSVKLPSGAGPLKNYTRFYTYGNDGEVLGRLIGGSRPADPPQRQWVKNYNSYPFSITDGGCGIVNVRFDIKSSRLQTWCNGVP